MEWFQVLILAVVQGFTEFLPISSSGHLVLPKELLGWPDQGLAFDVAVHVGSLAAVLIYFRKDVVQLLSAWLQSLASRQGSDDSRLAWCVILATVNITENTGRSDAGGNGQFWIGWGHPPGGTTYPLDQIGTELPADAGSHIVAFVGAPEASILSAQTIILRGTFAAFPAGLSWVDDLYTYNATIINQGIIDSDWSVVAISGTDGFSYTQFSRVDFPAQTKYTNSTDYNPTLTGVTSVATSLIASGTAQATGTLTIAAGASVIVYSDIDLSAGESVVMERTYNSGSNYRPAGAGKTLIDNHNREARVIGPGEFRFTKSATSEAKQIWYDS